MIAEPHKKTATQELLSLDHKEKHLRILEYISYDHGFFVSNSSGQQVEISESSFSTRDIRLFMVLTVVWI